MDTTVYTVPYQPAQFQTVLLQARIRRLEARIAEFEDAQTAAAVGEALDAIHAFQARSFWQRWRWLLTGR